MWRTKQKAKPKCSLVLFYMLRKQLLFNIYDKRYKRVTRTCKKARPCIPSPNTHTHTPTYTDSSSIQVTWTDFFSDNRDRKLTILWSIYCRSSVLCDDFVLWCENVYQLSDNYTDEIMVGHVSHHKSLSRSTENREKGNNLILYCCYLFALFIKPVCV